MSTWFANPTTANKLRQSYLKGFLDISGGGILVRADNSLNFYTTSGLGSDITKPSFAMDATNIQVKTPGANTLTAVPTSNLSYLSDLNENVKSAFIEIRSHFTGAADTNTSALAVTADAKIGGNLAVGGNATFDQQVAIAGNLNIAQNLITKGNGFFGGNLEVAGSQVINMNLYVKGDTMLYGRLFVTNDASFHANISSYGQIVSLGHMMTQQDLSAGGNLRVDGISILKSKATITAGGLEVTGNVSMHNELAVDGNATVTKNLIVSGNSALTGNSTVSGSAGVAGDFDLSGAAALHSTLDVDGITTLKSALGVTGNATVSGWAGFKQTMDVSGAVALHSTLDVDDNTVLKKELGVTGNATVSGWAGFKKAVDVSGNTFLHGTLKVSGASTLDSRVTITDGGASVTGPLDVKADSSMNFYNAGSNDVKFSVGPNNFTVINSPSNGTNTDALATVPNTKLSYIYDLNENVKSAFAEIRSHFTGAAATSTSALDVTADAKIGGNLAVGGNASFDQQVAIAGNLNIAQNLVTKGNGFFGGNLEVAGNQVINMNLYVKGDTFLNGRLFVTRDASFHANISAYGQVVALGHMITAQDLSAGGNLLVTGLTTLKSKATITAGGLEVTGDVSMNDNFSLGGNAAIVGNASVTKNLVVTGNSSVTGNSALTGKLDVTGATTLSSTLDVTQKATFSADVEVQGDMLMANTKTFTTGNLKITDSDYNTPCHISATAGNLTLGTDDASKWVHITSNLVVDGSINFLGSLTQTNVNIQVSDELDINANGTVALKATQNAGTTYDVASFYNSAQVAPIFIVGKNNTVAINKAAADANVCFDVNGTSQFSADMSLNSTLRVAEKITAKSDVELTAGNLKVTVGITDIQELKVNTTSTFTGLATFNGGVNLGGAFIDQSTYW